MVQHITFLQVCYYRGGDSSGEAGKVLWRRVNITVYASIDEGNTDSPALIDSEFKSTPCSGLANLTFFF